MRERPLSITAIAILHFVFGGWGILFGICGGVGLLAGGGSQKWFISSGGGNPKQDRVEKMSEDLQKAIDSGPAYQAVQIGDLVISLALSITMIMSGVGLLQMRPWGRFLSIVYALVSIALKIFGLVYAVAFILPAFSDFLKTHTAETPEEQMVIGIMRMVAYLPPISQLIFMIYPIVVLIIMLRPAIAAAFRESTGFQKDIRDERDRRD